MTPERQLSEWVAGRPKCPNSRGECCPDFSCCRPKLLWPKRDRQRYMVADDAVRDRMLVGALAAFIEGEGHTIV